MPPRVLLEPLTKWVIASACWPGAFKMHWMCRHNMQTPSKWSTWPMPIQEGPTFPTVQWQKSGKCLEVFPYSLGNHEKEIAWIQYYLWDLLYPATYLQKKRHFFCQSGKKKPKHTVYCRNRAALKYVLKVKLTCLELLMNISIMATMRSEILETAEKLSTAHPSPTTPKFSVWINCEDVNLMKNKGRVYTHISAGISDEDFLLHWTKEISTLHYCHRCSKKRSALLPGATAPTSVQLSANIEQLLFNIT